MRVDFPGMPVRLASDPFGNRFGLGAIIAGMRGLGECVNIAGDMICDDPSTTGGLPSVDPNKCDTATGFDGFGVACSGQEIAGNSVTPSDGEYVTNCTGYDSYGNCAACGAGTKLNTWNGQYTSCDSTTPGAVPAPKKPTQTSNWGSIFNNIGSIFGSPKPISAANAQACAAAHGTWNGAQCMPANTVSLGGMTLSMSTLLIIGVVAFVALKKK